MSPQSNSTAHALGAASISLTRMGAPSEFHFLRQSRDRLRWVSARILVWGSSRRIPNDNTSTNYSEHPSDKGMPRHSDSIAKQHRSWKSAHRAERIEQGFSKSSSERFSLELSTLPRTPRHQRTRVAGVRRLLRLRRIRRRLLRACSSFIGGARFAKSQFAKIGDPLFCPAQQCATSPSADRCGALSGRRSFPRRRKPMARRGRCNASRPLALRSA